MPLHLVRGLGIGYQRLMVLAIFRKTRIFILGIQAGHYSAMGVITAKPWVRDIILQFLRMLGIVIFFKVFHHS